jgi:hypothetical protein
LQEFLPVDQSVSIQVELLKDLPQLLGLKKNANPIQELIKVMMVQLL